MRFLSTAFVLVFLTSFTFLRAQVWLEAGPKATVGPNGYYNSVLANDSQHDYSLNVAFNYGLTAGLNFGDFHGLNFEVLWGTYFQDLISLESEDSLARNNLEWEVMDFYALYRYYPTSGMYIEAGPKFTRILEVSQNRGIRPLDVMGKYEDSYISGVLGFGAFLSGSEVMVLKAGIRLEYGFTDLVSAEGMADNFPANYSNELDLGSTIPFRASFGLEMSFGIGGIAQGACGRRGFVLGGRY